MVVMEERAISWVSGVQVAVATSSESANIEYCTYDIGEHHADILTKAVDAKIFQKRARLFLN